ncbi:hypothetical protein TMatcc_000394 [Talaromyces marneffei ATCC 18224]|uniref:Ubiquitin-like protein smt3 n=1 Tax=Talaromyces marneffei (strain ATCC 18224 / CBS 334.59 / QM 7333) TaxID=441960 RepID=B6QQM6_TALMQ|nr:uncharacterized protein EYB26_005471 [Talaromyces marneffei]EEA20410.1 conserved hypothetical protein [Talaromyces marneffei ATCC 18224]KAE8549397.1 hypothetical protein EYB25_007918 [Talaromyces marneffei]QGA17795.1 hypothetical protein EYB26_005471 [Talaromyces marneffei]
MASDLPAESKASIEKSLEELNIQTKKPDPDISRLSLSAADTIATTTVKGSTEKKSAQKKKAAVADSWEDELSEEEYDTSTTETEKESDTTAKLTSPLTPTKSEGPLAPPPTPSTNYDGDDYGLPQWGRVPSSNTITSSAAPGRVRDGARVRPEKQTAVASRLIAGALGIRAPKRTEEQRAYDRAMKEKEIKRRNKEKEEEAKARQDEERVKAAVWDA